MSAASDIVSVIMDLGASMLEAGAEVYRVEDTLMRLLCAYGAKRAHVFAIPSSIVVTALFTDGAEVTCSRRVLAVNTNLELLDRMNDLARGICVTRLDAESVRASLDNVKRLKRYNRLQKMLIYAAISFSFAVFFGGGLTDALTSACIGMILFFCARASHGIGGNQLFTDIFCAAVSAMLSVLAVKFGLAQDADKVIIGNIMLLIPGVELVNGMRDFIAGDIQAGLLHVAEAIILAAGIAVGAAGTLMLMGG